MTKLLARRLAGFVVASALLAGCAGEALNDTGSASTARVTIMAFNVENLFDNVDAPGKNDETYLPVSAKQNQPHIDKCNLIPVDRWREQCLEMDWNDAVVEHKLGVVAETIRQADGGRGADVIALQEVENVAILERLRNEYLADLGYGPAILVEGDDLRGIDVAFLSRLPLVGEPVLHMLELPEEYAGRAGDTRGVLEATFELPGGSLLTGFSVHFPAPFHPTAMRIAAYSQLNALQGTVPPHHNLFAAGDFNTTSTEDKQQSLLERFVRPTWIVAHDLCGGCPGTHYYARDDTWSFLDMILYAPAIEATSRWRMDRESVRLATGFGEQLREDGTPRRYDAAARAGVSDHLPLLIDIEATP